MTDASDWPYRFETIALDRLFVDEAYQRPLSSFLEKIKRRYNPALIGTLATSDRATASTGRVRKDTRERYAVIDGQTRMEGMRSREETVAPCLVYENLSRRDEARLFALFQTERRGMATYLRFRAALVSGDPEAAAIAALVRSAGFRAAGDGGEYGIKSIAALEWLYRRDPELLKRVLSIIGTAWEDQRPTPSHSDERTRGEILKGLGRFLTDTKNVDDSRLISALAGINPSQLRHRANALREGSGSAGNFDVFVRDAVVGVYSTRRKAA
jgi:uncharacterized protein DUF6551